MAKAESKEIFKTLPVPSALREMALPTIFSQIIILIYNMADTFYLGRTNNPYMVAGASLILPVFNICLSLAGLTGIDGGALISRLLGEGREDEAKKVSAFSFLFIDCHNSGIVLKAERLPLNVGIGICQGMMPIVAYNYSAGNHDTMYGIVRFYIKVGIVVSVVSITLYEIFAGHIMRIFIPEQQTVLLGTGFLRIRCLATPLMFMSFFMVYVFQGLVREINHIQS